MPPDDDALQRKYVGSDYASLTTQQKVGRVVERGILPLDVVQRQTARETIRYMSDEDARRALHYFLKAASRLELTVDVLEDAARKRLPR